MIYDTDIKVRRLFKKVNIFNIHESYFKPSSAFEISTNEYVCNYLLKIECVTIENQAYKTDPYK